MSFEPGLSLIAFIRTQGGGEDTRYLSIQRSVSIFGDWKFVRKVIFGVCELQLKKKSIFGV